MQKKVLFILIPFLFIFLFGVFLLLRPQYKARVTEVADTFARQEKTGGRSPHRHTVYYATVRAEINGEDYTVTVHDDAWEPLKAGDEVAVTRDLSGRIVEYRTENARALMLFSIVMGPVCLLLYWILSKRRKQR